MYASSSYAKILGETTLQPREFPRSVSKAKDVEKERLKVGDNNGQLRIADATSGGACKATWAKRNHPAAGVSNYGNLSTQAYKMTNIFIFYKRSPLKRTTTINWHCTVYLYKSMSIRESRNVQN